MVPLEVAAVALTVIVAGAVNVKPFAGAVIVTVGGVAAGGVGAGFTVTVTPPDVVVNPALLVALAVRTYVPAATFVHDRLYGLEVSVPISVEPA